MKAYYSIDLAQPTHQARVGTVFPAKGGAPKAKFKKTRTIDVYNKLRKLLADQFGSENVIEGEDPVFPTRKTLTVI